MLNLQLVYNLLTSVGVMSAIKKNIHTSNHILTRVKKL